MSNSVLQGANLTEANLAQANLTEANLDDVKKQLCKSAEYSSPPFCIKQLK
ncbi:pentapeptide repeat-containing protein [Arsenophonus apicola]|uniref:pentapeptide repeat-containing protein n=1 Tax=Arsenophonus apicola TaxID=2879119 RepID=UPI00387915AB